MRTIRALSGRGLLALTCSHLLVFPPVSVASDPGVIAGDALASTRVAATAAALTFLCPEGPNNAPESIAVAKLTGTADKNGQPLLNGSIVSSGDVLSTHGDSAILLASVPQERLWLGPNTSAKLTKESGNLAVALTRGTLSFQSRGHIQVSIENHDGLALRSRPDTLVVAQLSLVNDLQAQVRVQEGSLELVEGNRSVALQPGQPRRISSTGPGSLEGPTANKKLTAQEASPTQSEAGSIAGNVVSSDLFVVSGANVTLTSVTGKTLTAISDQGGKFAFSDVAPGTYALRVVKPGFQTYELKDVVVRAGNESSLYVQLGGGGGAKSSNNNLLLWVVIGGAAAAGIGAYAATRGSSSSSNSPSTVQ